MKKVLSLVLAVMLVFGMSATAFASSFKAITYTNGDVGDWALGYSFAAPGSSIVMDAGPGDVLELEIYLNSKNNPGMIYPATRTAIRADKIDVKTKVSEGSKAIDSYAVKYHNTPGWEDANGVKQSVSTAYVKIEYVDPFVSTKELDFSYTVYLTENKSRNTSTEVDVSGTLENEKQFVDENDDYVYLYDVPVVEAEDYVKNIEVDLGDGIVIVTKMFDGKSYYGYVSQEIKTEDDEVISTYPSIDTIYYLQTINLNSAGNYTKFDLDDKFYVYNADLEYIGTTADKLPYSTKYYLSTTELDVASAETDLDSIPSDVNTENVPSGGDDVPANVNENPGTGC